MTEAADLAQEMGLDMEPLSYITQARKFNNTVYTTQFLKLCLCMQAGQILLSNHEVLSLPHSYVTLLRFLSNTPGFTPSQFEERLNALGEWLSGSHLHTIGIFLRVRALVAANRYAF